VRFCQATGVDTSGDHWSNGEMTGSLVTEAWQSRHPRFLRAFLSFHDLVSKSLLISMRQRRGWQPALAMKQLAGLRMLADMVPFVAKHGRRSTRSIPEMPITCQVLFASPGWRRSATQKLETALNGQGLSRTWKPCDPLPLPGGSLYFEIGLHIV
jgi:hypothetical protein